MINSVLLHVAYETVLFMIEVKRIQTMHLLKTSSLVSVGWAVLYRHNYFCYKLRWVASVPVRLFFHTASVDIDIQRERVLTLFSWIHCTEYRSSAPTGVSTCSSMSFSCDSESHTVVDRYYRDILFHLLVEMSSWLEYQWGLFIWPNVRS